MQVLMSIFDDNLRRANSDIFCQFLMMLNYGLWRISSYFRCQYSMIIYRRPVWGKLWFLMKIFNHQSEYADLDIGYCMKVACLILLQMKCWLSSTSVDTYITLLYGCNSKAIISEGPFAITPRLMSYVMVDGVLKTCLQS